jgi:hypothetical protein
MGIPLNTPWFLQAESTFSGSAFSTSPPNKKALKTHLLVECLQGLFLFARIIGS